MTYPSDDLTKLTGPELAERLLAVYGDPNGYHPEAVEAGHRLREDTREWQRRLERERDGLRERVAVLEAQLCERKPVESWGDPKRCLVCGATHDGTMCPATTPTSVAPLRVKHGDGRGKFYPSANEPGEIAEPYDCDECNGTGVDASEPAERKAREERRYGYDRPGCNLTLAEAILAFEEGSAFGDVARHLREKLATLNAVEALEERWSGHSMARELREVLNGKR